ncbi:MAG: bifunctional folylpolyglutamate synthase/dihydrofolate synthase [Campylobacterales bacterium]|nr:bifunctional folylpolyglutamate synthase/dihydrofolate synthase [Campylobacterales bacterium]
MQKYLDLKPLYYKEIDYERFPKVYKSVKNNFLDKNIIHLIGTNGKGTTGRFLASALFSLGFSVGHYTSPHILEFNERIWIDGANATDDILEDAHQKLQTMLIKEQSDSLSYFEYTTLLAMVVFNRCDYIVLEAGLGGEHDATAVFDKILTLVTPIDFDHEAFLGNDIKSIATTKLNAIQNQAILANQRYDEVYEVADEISASKGVSYKRVYELLDEVDFKNIEIISKGLNLAEYLKDNLSLAISALKSLGISYEAYNFKNSKLFGRVTQFRDNVLLDVGHNTLAANSIYKALQPNRYTLIYNTYSDKNYKEILSILKPIITAIEIIDVDEERIERKDKLKEVIKELGIEFCDFKELDNSKNYLVFGSFSVAEAFLRRVGDE